MRFSYVGRNIEVTEGLKNVLESKMQRLEKYFDTDKDIKIVMSVQKNSHKIEVTIKDINMRAEQTSSDMYKSIDLVVDKLEGNIRKYKNKLLRRDNKNAQCLSNSSIIFESNEKNDEPKIVKRKTISSKPMSEEEAILQMELSDHDFFMFKDINGAAKVLYKRNDNQYGLIEAV